MYVVNLWHRFDRIVRRLGLTTLYGYINSTGTKNGTCTEGFWLLTKMFNVTSDDSRL